MGFCVHDQTPGRGACIIGGSPACPYVLKLTIASSRPPLCVFSRSIPSRSSLVRCQTTIAPNCAIRGESLLRRLCLICDVKLLQLRCPHWLPVCWSHLQCRAPGASVELLAPSGSQSFLAPIRRRGAYLTIAFHALDLQYSLILVDSCSTTLFSPPYHTLPRTHTHTPLASHLHTTMSAPPQIPPRPSRVQNSTPNSAHMDVPKIPPRPKRSVDRSVSPGRDAFAPSPLNDPSFLHTGTPHKDSHLSAELPARPPSVSLPSLGQEGSEYASFEDLSKTLSNQSQNGESPEQTKQVAGDLPLHAPKASLPASSAKTRIQTVTRTDSDQAAAAGFGKSLVPEAKPSGDSSRSVSSRPSSIYREEEEHGIPEIGVQVPMYPNAGDVQAPTPSPYESAVPTGVGFFNKGDKPRHHTRTKSGREIFHGPPGSYGLHGHGKIGNDEFEQNWYKKHPDDLKREKAGEYGPHIQENRKEYHWGGEKLDKLVRNASVEGYGLGMQLISQ